MVPAGLLLLAFRAPDMLVRFFSLDGVAFHGRHGRAFVALELADVPHPRVWIALVRHSFHLQLQKSLAHKLLGIFSDVDPSSPG